MTEIAPSPPAELAEPEPGFKPHKLRTRRRSSRKPSWQRRIRKRFNRLKLRNVLLVLASIVAVIVVGGTALVLNTSSRAEAALDNLGRIMSTIQGRPGTDLTLMDFARLNTGLNEVAGALSSAERFASIVRPLAPLNGGLDGTLSVLDAAGEMTQAARSMLTGLEPVLTFLVAGADDQTITTNISSGQRVVDLLRLGRGQFASAAENLSAARAALDGMNPAALPSNLVLTAQSARSYLEQLENINQVLLDSPDLLTQALGLGAETSILVLAQNNDELRPSGGYLSTYGWLTLRNGRITNYSFSPTTATSPNPPSADGPPVAVPTWWIGYGEPIYAAWDGSWYADFPSTAEMAMWYYNSGGNPQSPVSAVLSIDVAGFEEILKALGSVTLPAYDVVVTPDNFRDVVYDIRAFGQGETPHKQFVAALYRQILSDWQQTTTPEANNRLLGGLLSALQQKHIMLYFADPRLNEAIGLLGWAGAQNMTTGHDYVLDADANLGNKSNRSVIRQSTYDVTLGADGTLASRLRISYDYSARVASADPAVDEEHHGPLDYRNLQQVFVPANSALEASSGFSAEPLVLPGDAHTLLVSRFQIPYDSSESFEYAYSVPDAIEELGTALRYRLLIQRQPGMMNEAVSVQVQLPPGASVLSVSPEPAARYTLEQQILEFQFVLQTDQWIEIVYSGPRS